MFCYRYWPNTRKSEHAHTGRAWFAESERGRPWTLAHAEQHYLNANDLHWAQTDVTSSKKDVVYLFTIYCMCKTMFSWMTCPNGSLSPLLVVFIISFVSNEWLISCWKWLTCCPRKHKFWLYFWVILEYLIRCTTLIRYGANTMFDTPEEHIKLFFHHISTIL